MSQRFNKHVAETKTKAMISCDYLTVANESDSTKLTIRDMNLGRRSVTNDIDSVVKYLLQRNALKEGMRLFYYDSEGRLDEVLFDIHGFVDFGLI